MHFNYANRDGASTPLSLTRNAIFRVVKEILFWGVVVGAVLFAVTTTDMIGQVFTGFSVNVPCELPYCATGWTSVAG